MEDVLGAYSSGSRRSSWERLILDCLTIALIASMAIALMRLRLEHQPVSFYSAERSTMITTSLSKSKGLKSGRRRRSA